MRAKVAAIRAAERDHPGGTDAEEAALLCGIGLRHLEQGRVRLVLVGGAPGSGKTTLATALGDTLPAAVLSSDRVRKELSGLPPTRHVAAPFEEGIYGRGMTARTYALLARRTGSLLAMGESVIVDATFSRAELRLLFGRRPGGLLPTSWSSDALHLRPSSVPVWRPARRHRTS